MGISPFDDEMNFSRRSIEAGLLHYSSDGDPVRWFYRKFGCESIVGQPEVKLPNPNPNNFTIEDAVKIGNFVVCRVNYPDATNFEGDKIIVLKDTTRQEVVELDSFDPHFAEDSNVFARFRPDKDGWEAALAFAAFMAKTKVQPTSD